MLRAMRSPTGRQDRSTRGCAESTTNGSFKVIREERRYPAIRRGRSIRLDEGGESDLSEYREFQRVNANECVGVD